MRTTMTIDDDVALHLRKKMQKAGGRSFKEIVNETLRDGLLFSETKADKAKKPFKITGARDLKPRTGLNFDKISELIEQIERPFHR